MRLGILTGGGDVAPLNALLASVKKNCLVSGIDLIGYKYGWGGLLNDDYIELNKIDFNPYIGGTLLKSSRVNLKKEIAGPERILENLGKNKIDGLIVIGGEDTLSNALLIKDFPKVLISKTIDNDVGTYSNGVFENHFTLGHPTAAEKISSYVSLQEGLRTTAVSHERIIVVEAMGMHAGWLALSSASGNPDFIVIPEFPLNYNDFEEKVRERFLKQRNVIIVISEGARWNNGSYISADESEKDSFGHPRFRGTAEILANKLKQGLSQHFDTRNVNSVNPSYLYRSGRPNPLDFSIAMRMGKLAVKDLLRNSGSSDFLSITFHDSKYGARSVKFNDLENIEQFHRFVDPSLYNAKEFKATDFTLNYLASVCKSFI